MQQPSVEVASVNDACVLYICVCLSECARAQDGMF